jgi:hypothetical protein
VEVLYLHTTVQDGKENHKSVQFQTYPHHKKIRGYRHISVRTDIILTQIGFDVILIC